MGDLAERIKTKTDRLNHRRRIISNIASFMTAACVFGIVLSIANVKHSEKYWFYAALWLAGIAAVRVVANMCFWMLELFYVRWFYSEVLLALGSKIDVALFATASQRARCSKYGTFKALSLLQLERPVTSIAMVMICVVAFQIIVPIILLGYCLYIRFGSTAELSATETFFISETGRHPMTIALFTLSTQDQLNRIIGEVLQGSSEEEIERAG
jgi:hypothetical protein